MTQSLGYKLTAAVTNMAVQSYIVDHTISNCIAVAMTVNYNLQGWRKQFYIGQANPSSMNCTCVESKTTYRI